MRVAVVSDVHLEFGPLVLNNTEGADLLILAGDICVARDLELADKKLYAENKRAQRYLDFFEDCAAKFPEVVYIMGNHEHYNGDFAYTYSILKRKLAHLPNLHVLEKETFVVDDVTFICGTMWTDMNNEDPLTMQNMPRMMNDFHGVTNDHNKVTRKVPLYDNENFETNKDGYVVRNVVGFKFKEEAAKFTPADAVADHRKMVDYIKHVTAEHANEKFVVVTHHAPCGLSIHEHYQGDTMMNGGFYTELGDFIADRPQIKLWVHGHMHNDFDYVVGETRVVCNPRGYVGHEDRARTYQVKYIDV